MNLHRPWIPELIQHNLPANLLDQEGMGTTNYLSISRVSDALFDLREILLLDTSASFTKHFRAEVYREYLEYVNTHRATTSLDDYLNPPSSLSEPADVSDGVEDYEEFDNFEDDSEEDYEEFDNFEDDSEEDYEEFDNFEDDSEEDYEEFDNFEDDSEEDYEEFDVFESLDAPQPVFRPAPSSTLSSPQSTSPSTPLTPTTRLEKGLVGAFDTVSSFFRK